MSREIFQSYRSRFVDANTTIAVWKMQDSFAEVIILVYPERERKSRRIEGREKLLRLLQSRVKVSAMFDIG